MENGSSYGLNWKFSLKFSKHENIFYILWLYNCTDLYLTHLISGIHDVWLSGKVIRLSKLIDFNDHFVKMYIGLGTFTSSPTLIVDTYWYLSTYDK